MGDIAWEQTYAAGLHVNSWPWSDLVSLFFRHLKDLSSRQDTSHIKVLELGLGTGNNISFWETVGVEYFGIEQSATAVEKMLARFPHLRSHIRVGDFSELIPTNEEFDIICDRASVTHGTTLEIEKTLKASHGALKRGGLFLGVDWFSTRHSDFFLPTAELDENTRSDFMEGQFVGVGKVHFSDRQHLLELFSDFEILELVEKVTTRQYPDISDEHFASWNVVARKR